MANFDQEIQAQLQGIKHDAQARQASASHVALAGVGRAAVDNTPGTGVATPEDKLMAIQDIYDMQEKTSIPFIVLGELAKTIRNKLNSYDGEKIEIGFPASNLVPEIRSLFKQWNFQETKYGYKYYFTPPIKWDVKIPVEIHCWSKKYPFFSNPDVGFFGVDEYKLPNPFEAYWKVRGIIQ